MTQKGFTLVELLVVIGILAVLATATVLVLNPVELIKRGRDATRISDINTIVSALALYMGDATTPNVQGDLTCYSGTGFTGGGNVYRPSGANTITESIFVKGTANAAATYDTGRGITAASTDWIPVDLGGITSGAPFAQFPIDPVGIVGASGDTAYRYACGSSTTFAVGAYLESTKYASSANKAVNNKNFYIAGNATIY